VQNGMNKKMKINEEEEKQTGFMNKFLDDYEVLADNKINKVSPFSTTLNSANNTTNRLMLNKGFLTAGKMVSPGKNMISESNQFKTPQSENRTKVIVLNDDNEGFVVNDVPDDVINSLFEPPVQQNEVNNAGNNNNVLGSKTSVTMSENSQSFVNAYNNNNTGNNNNGDVNSGNTDGNGNSNVDGVTCMICYESNKTSTEKKFQLSRCGHVACEPCWGTWLQVKVECPMCKSKVRPKQLITMHL